MTGSYIKFFASGNEVSLKWIAEGDVEVFAATVRKGMAEGTATRVVAKKAIAPKPPKRRTHWLAYVLGLALVVPVLGLTLAAGFTALIASPADDPAPRPQASRRSAPTAKIDPSVTRSQQAKPTRSSAHPANPFAPVEPIQYDNTLASDGQVLYEAIVAKNPELYRFYKEESLAPITDEHSVFRTDGWSHGVDISGVSRGFAAMIALSEESWNGLSDSQRDSLGHFLTRESPDTGWVVYVGEVKRIDSRDEIMGDRTPMSSREWDWTPTP